MLEKGKEKSRMYIKKLLLILCPDNARADSALALKRMVCGNEGYGLMCSTYEEAIGSYDNYFHTGVVVVPHKLDLYNIRMIVKMLSRSIRVIVWLPNDLVIPCFPWLIKSRSIGIAVLKIYNILDEITHGVGYVSHRVIQK